VAKPADLMGVSAELAVITNRERTLRAAMPLD
jgi:hypothetical protein